MHVVMSAIMLTNKNVLSVNDLSYLENVNMIKNVSLVDQYMYNNTFSERFTEGIGLIYFIFGILFVV